MIIVLKLTLNRPYRIGIIFFSSFISIGCVLSSVKRSIRAIQKKWIYLEDSIINIQFINCGYVFTWINLKVVCHLSILYFRNVIIIGNSFKVFHYYHFSLEVFTSAWAEGLSLEIEWQQVSSSLNNAVVWMVSTRPPTSKSSRPFNNPLVTVTTAPITIGIIVTFVFHSFSILLQDQGTYLSFPILSVLFCGQPG